MMHFFISSLMHILICFSALLLFSTILLTALICECCISIPFILCQSDSSFCWVAYREFFFSSGKLGVELMYLRLKLLLNFLALLLDRFERKYSWGSYQLMANAYPALNVTAGTVRYAVGFFCALFVICWWIL